MHTNAVWATAMAPKGANFLYARPTINDETSSVTVRVDLETQLGKPNPKRRL